MSNDERMHRMLRPPPGGAARLKASLDQRELDNAHRTSTRGVHAFAAVGSLIVVLIAIAAVTVRQYRERPAQVFADRVAAVLNQADGGASAGELGIVAELPSRNADVRIIVSSPLSNRVPIDAQP